VTVCRFSQMRMLFLFADLDLLQAEGVTGPAPAAAERS
jgi:hypothetical protein